MCGQKRWIVPRRSEENLHIAPSPFVPKFSFEKHGPNLSGQFLHNAWHYFFFLNPAFPLFYRESKKHKHLRCSASEQTPESWGDKFSISMKILSSKGRTSAHSHVRRIRICLVKFVKFTKVRSHGSATAVATVPLSIGIHYNKWIHSHWCSNGNGTASKWVQTLFCVAAPMAK